jgi:hypothetical protein
MTKSDVKRSFGHRILGPICAEFALRLWIYVSTLSDPADIALLFCARGGLRLQLLYNLFLAKTRLESPVHTNALMVSRLVATRAALTKDADCAYEQINYQLSGGTLPDVIKILTGMQDTESEQLSVPNQIYSTRVLQEFFATDMGKRALAKIRLQDGYFREHLAHVSKGRRRIVLCDTGVFGSTLRLLIDGVPEFSWSAVMFARNKNKNLSNPHFARNVGLSLEADDYCPWQKRTSILRNWFAIESIFEPTLPSVTRFEKSAGLPRSNLEIDTWERRIEPEPDSVYAGVLQYIGGLSPACVLRVEEEAAAAWAAMRQAIVWPEIDDTIALNPGQRSIDFGSEATVLAVPSGRPLSAILRSRSLWREGEIARSFPFLRKPLLLAIEIVYGLRWCMRRLYRRLLQ